MKNQDTTNAWEPVLKLCTTGMMLACLMIGLAGGVAGLVMMLYVLDKSSADTDPLSIGDGLGVLSGFFLFSTFLPMAIALGVGKAILMKMEEDHDELD